MRCCSTGTELGEQYEIRKRERERQEGMKRERGKESQNWRAGDQWSERERERRERGCPSVDAAPDLTDAVSSISSITSGQLGLEKLPFVVREAVESVVKVTLASDAALHRHISCSLSTVVPRVVEGDKQKFTQVLWNLVCSFLSSPSFS